jgi:hypothetical protein
MSAWPSSLQPSPDLGLTTRPVTARRSMAPRRLLLALALASLALGLMLFGVVLDHGFGGASQPAASGVRAHSYSQSGLLSLPLAAQGPVSTALGADQPAYRIHGLTARNPAQRFSARFGRSGVTITAGSARFAISLQAFGRIGAMQQLGAVVPSARTNRVEYARGGLQEWYANGPLGLEQGFDIARRPAGSGALTLSLTAPAGARLDHGSVLLPGGLRYTGLHATDAQGHALPAWLQLSSGRLQLRVDDRRAIYPVRIDPFVQAAALTSSDGAAGDLGGRAVAISGNTIVVGAETHTVGPNQGAGAVYVFTEPSGGWANATQTAELTATEATSGHEHHLGNSVGISGNTIVAGAPGAGPHPSQGAAYVFAKPAGEWKDATQTAELIGSDGAEGDATGYEAVAISGSTVVMGARSHTAHGALYVFTEPGGGWAACPLVGGVNTCGQTAKLTVSASTELGIAVSISENTIAALGQGDPAYVFVKPGSGWADATKATAELTASSGAILTDGTAQIAISGNTLVEGSWQGDALYVFEKPAGEWANATTETAELTASDGTPGNDLGFSVATEGETIVAGAPQQEEGTNGVQGAVYTYAKPSTGWANATQTQELTTSGGVKGELLGWDVALGGETILGGAPESKIGANSRQGTAYVFATPESLEKFRGSGGTGNTGGTGTGNTTGTGAGTSGSGTSSSTGTGTSGGTGTGAGGASTGKGSGSSLAAQLGLPSTKACLSQRKLTIHIAEHLTQSTGTTKIKSAEVLLDGHTVAKVTGSNLVAHVSLVGLEKGSFKITVKATTSTGKTLSASSIFHTCKRATHKHK